jgi:hypothetical protein
MGLPMFVVIGTSGTVLPVDHLFARSKAYLIRVNLEPGTSTTTTTTSDGTVSQFSPDTIMVSSTTSPTPVSYSYSKTTTYVDENGNPVSSETVKSGVPVTIYYTQDGDKMVATKVIVRKTTTTTTPAP